MARCHHTALSAPGRPVHRGRGHRPERAPDSELVHKWCPVTPGQGQLTMDRL